MGLFSKWIILYRSSEKQAWRQKREEFKSQPSASSLKEMYGGGFFQLRKIGYFGGVSDTLFVDLSDEELQEKNVRQNTITIKTSSGSTLQFDNTILHDKNAVENVQTLMKITREPSQDVIDLKEKLTVFDDIFGERIESIIAEVIGTIGDVSERDEEYEKQIQRKHEMKLTKEGGVNGIHIEPEDNETEE